MQLRARSMLNQGGCVSHRFTMLLLMFDSFASSLRMLEKLGNAERLEYVINVYNIYVTFLFLNGGFFLIYLRQNKRSAFLWYLGLVSSLHSWPSNVCSYSLMKWLIILLLYLQCMIGVSHSYYSPSSYILPALLWWTSGQSGNFSQSTWWSVVRIFLLLISVICWESHHNRVCAHINLRQVHRVHFRLGMTVKKSTEPPITLLPNHLSPQGQNKHLA